MYTPGEKTPRVGRVSIDIHGKSYRLRFTYPEGNNHSFSIARATPEGWTTAIKAAQLIDRDIDLDDFDDTYARYSPRHARKLKKQQIEATKKQNLVTLWKSYTKTKVDTTSQSTKSKEWVRVEKLLGKVDPRLLSLEESDEFIQELLTYYSPGTLNPRFRLLYAAVNMAVKQNLIDSNPYSQIYSPYKRTRKKPECFEINEIKAIIAAFESDEFKPITSPYSHSYYTPIVQFLALSGCRPSEAHALTWDDIKQKNGKTFIRFNKAYTASVLLNTTKTHEIRLFPCNNQMTALIASLPKIKNQYNLIFPSIGLGYVNQNNFRKRYWKPVIEGLVKQGKVDKYLKPYCLRHSFITRLVREGVDIATVASLSGNSSEVIMANYLAPNQNFDLPEL